MVDQQRLDLAIILGQRLNPDGSLVDNLIERLKGGAFVNKYYSDERGVTVPLMVCGGDVVQCGTTEADAMAKTLIREMNVYTEDIIVERRSTTTAENAEFAHELWKVMPVRPRRIALVTSDFHLDRALLLFERAFSQEAPGSVSFQGIPIASKEPRGEETEENINTWSLKRRRALERTLLDEEKAK